MIDGFGFANGFRLVINGFRLANGFWLRVIGDAFGLLRVIWLVMSRRRFMISRLIVGRLWLRIIPARLVIVIIVAARTIVIIFGYLK